MIRIITIVFATALALTILVSSGRAQQSTTAMITMQRDSIFDSGLCWRNETDKALFVVKANEAFVSYPDYLIDTSAFEVIDHTGLQESVTITPEFWLTNRLFIVSVTNMHVTSADGHGHIALKLKADGNNAGLYSGSNPESIQVDDGIQVNGELAANICPEDGCNYNPPRTGDVDYIITFAYPVIGFGADDLELSGESLPTTAVVTGSGTEYHATISGMSASGRLIVSIKQDSVNDGCGPNSGVLLSSVAYEYVPLNTHDLTIAVDPIGGGTTIPSAGMHSFESGTVVAVTAAPSDGYVFDHWSGACTGNGACSVTMNANKSVTAHFTQLDYTLTINVVGSGAVCRCDPGPYHYGDVVKLTATPIAGWNFSGWSGDLTGTGNPKSITMDANKTVTATFAPPTGYLNIFIPVLMK